MYVSISPASLLFERESFSLFPYCLCVFQWQYVCVSVCARVLMAVWLIAAFELRQTTGASLSQSLMAHLSLGDPFSCTCPPASEGHRTHTHMRTHI